MTAARKIPSLLTTIGAADHRVIGLRQKLFFFHELSQGSCFFQPRGTRIYNKLTDYLRQQYFRRGYQEVITPNIYNCELWKTSGHWDHYQKEMMRFNLGDREFSLKPMNCPGHCLMYKNEGNLSDDKLPIRWADFGVLHRNELSGTLRGLTRVRRFQQDDAHIFCTPDQVESEVKQCLDFASQVYELFNFSIKVKLSLRPESYMGTLEMWNKAEDSLRQALKNSQVDWEEQESEGAFYGPKIDLEVQDCQGRSQQCATIQLDFQLPQKFDLSYRNRATMSTERPVIIHRAILGSIERFIAMVAENTAGRWPFFLSPLQAQVIPIHANHNEYSQKVCHQLRDSGFWADCDITEGLTLNAKVRNAILYPYNLVLVVGEREAANNTVNCRILFSEEELLNYVDKSRMRNDIGNQMDETSGSEKGRRKSVRNLNISVERLIEHFREFERRHVDRADLELLMLLADDRELNKGTS